MRGHPTVFVLSIAAAMIVANFAVDVLYGAFPGSPPVAGIKQAITGA